MRKTAALVILLSITLGCSYPKKKPSQPKPAFEKILFHTSGCFGTCPTYHLQVDSTKNVKLFAESVFKQDSVISYVPDTAKTGYFTGRADDSTFSRLNHEMETIGLDSLQFEGENCCDGSIITIIIYYQGKRKFLQSMFPPHKAKNLISILYSICENSTLYRTNERFDIEYEGQE